MKQELKDRIEVVKDVDLSGVTTSFNHDDIIDSRDIQERINELESEFEDHLYNWKKSEGDDKIVFESDLESWLDENEDEYVSLMTFKGEVDGYTSEWNDGATIIADSHFEDYAKELAEEIGAINKNEQWPLNCIDWGQAANELQMDFREITFDGGSYWVR